MSDPSRELIDVVNPATGSSLGPRSRSDVHAEGLWHQVFHCMVIRPSVRSIVLQQRSQSKAAFPGKLDLSVTGHLEAGESPVDGIREAEEELGVAFDPAALIPLGTRLLADDNGEGQNRERVNVFFVLDDRPISDYAPPAQEVEALVEVDIDSFLALLDDADRSVEATAVEAGTGTVTTRRIRRDDLVEGTAGYWVVLGVMAGRCADGRAPIGI